MGKQVILTLMQGSFEQGFPVMLRILPETKTESGPIQCTGKLPAAPNIWELFLDWQLAYRQTVISDSRLEPLPQQLNNYSCQDLGYELLKNFNIWLNSMSNDWQKIRDKLQRSLAETDEFSFIIETSDSQLRQLPWQSWDLFSEYTRAEVALSVTEYKQVKISRKSSNNQVRILAILGDGKGIDIERDRDVIRQLPQADPTFLTCPKQDVVNNQLWDKEWHIFFFAGHSYSNADGKTGHIYLDQDNSLSLTNLKSALRTAIERGLQIAIFNSCDGLGLARELSDLNIPQVIIMREPVPDLVAQEFLQHFLRAFAQGKSIYLAVREARERLKILERQFPCASWLPVICQNPATVPPTWRDLCGEASSQRTEGSRGQQDDVGRQRSHQTLFGGLSLTKVLILSAIATSLVVGARHLGWLQSWELRANDQLQRMRSESAPDRRILIVGITDEDFKIAQEQDKPQNSSLSDLALVLLLKKLQQNQARAIGLDIYHDFPPRRFQVTLGKNKITLGQLMNKSNNLFAICKASDPEGNNSGISPPAEIPESRQAFSDIVTDANDILRRQLLAMNPKVGSPCNADLSLSAALAFYYLEANNPPIFYEFNKKNGEYRIRDVILKRLRPHTGVYQSEDTWGYQTLINYRSYNKSALNIAPQVSLKQILDGKINPNDIKDKIVLIGVTSPNTRDYIGTPYSNDEDSSKKMPGVVAQAQMISMILSAVLNHRPLLSFWPTWGDIIWIFAWSLVGGFLGWKFRYPYPLFLILVVTVSGGVLCASCFCLLEIYGYWVPLVPSALVLVVASGSATVLRGD